MPKTVVILNELGQHATGRRKIAGRKDRIDINPRVGGRDVVEHGFLGKTTTTPLSDDHIKSITERPTAPEIVGGVVQFIVGLLFVLFILAMLLR